MSNRGKSIPRDRRDESLLELASENAYKDIKNKYLFLLPDNWNITCGNKRLPFSEINKKLKMRGFSSKSADDYYGGNSGIETDGHIIYLEITQGDKTIKMPLYMGEMKKQGTNGKRLAEGMEKQAQGNAAGDRMAKNYNIAADYCYLCDDEFFPYNVYMHGYDFTDDEITPTTKSKLKPFFGSLNIFNPWFDKHALILMAAKKGGSCYYQGEDFTYQQLYESCYKCCETGIKHYLNKL